MMIRGAGGDSKSGGGEQHTPVEAPDTLHSTALARVVDLISEGEIGGFTLKDIYLDETPLQNADDSFNFKNVHVDIRTGTQDQEPLAGFPDVESETAVGVELTDVTPWTHSFTNLSVTSIAVRLAVAGLSQIDTETGDTNGYVVEYAIDLKVDAGAYVAVVENAFSGKASSPYERRHVIELPPATASWTVRVRRITPNSSSQYIQDDTSVVSYTEMIQANLRYPNSAVAGVIIDASQFRSIPSRAYRVYGRLIRVPANYDVATRAYATTGEGTSGGVWDGTFKISWTDNPAWIFFDMATHYRYGLGRFISDAQVNKWYLYQIAQYCDELVDDGLGGTEPRFTCNVYFQQAADAYKVMQDLASIFRGISYWAGGLINVMADKPADPVYVYTNANVIDGIFNYQGSSKQARHTVALVHWSDPADFGRGKVEYVPYEDGIARYGIQQTQTTAFGATSQGQAHRCGNWLLLSEYLETNTVSFDVGLDGAIPQPGQTVQVADELRAGVRIGGRIRTATTTVVTVDDVGAIAIANNLTVMTPDGVSQTRPVTAVGAETITVSPAFDVAPVATSVWSYASVEIPEALFRIIGVSENASQSITYSILAMQHNVLKFDESDFGIVVQPVNTAAAPPNTIAPPASVTVSTTSIIDGPNIRLDVLATWPKVVNATSYEVSFRRNLGDWTPPMRTRNLQFELESVASGDWKARVKAISFTGLASLERISDTVAVAPLPVYELLTDEDTGEILIDFDTGAPLYGE